MQISVLIKNLGTYIIICKKNGNFAPVFVA